MVKLTERDMQILSFLKEFKCSNTSTITNLYFPSLSTCERRLKKLVEIGKINRYRSNILEEYVYYRGKRPTNIKHAYTIAKVYSILNSNFEVLKHKVEFEVKYLNKTLRTDLMLVIRVNNKLVPILLEVDLNKPYDNKYTEYINNKYYLNKFPYEPIVISVSKFNSKSVIPIINTKLASINNLNEQILNEIFIRA